MILLNLTLPPLLYIYLGPAILSNVSLPALPMSSVAAFWDNGTPIPCWVLQDRLYVLQDGVSSYVMYVPYFANRSGVYILSINASEGAIVVIPPGVVTEVSSRYTLLSINRSGIYIYINTSNVTISFAPATLRFESAITSTRGSTSATIAFPVLAIVAAFATLVVVLAQRHKERCDGLGDTDKLILKTIERRGGRVARSELARELGLPASTLHKHLHKLVRYGYIKLVTEGGAQRVELLRECSDG